VFVAHGATLTSMRRLPRALRALLFSTAILTYGTLARADDALPQVNAADHGRFVAVLDWHDVQNVPEVWFDTTTARFAAQLDEIARDGIHVVTLAALRDHLTRGTPLPKRSIAITFDDNGDGIARNAFPLLVRHRFPATLFVHTNFVGKTTTKRHNTWHDLQTMERSGLVTVESLTANHPPDLRALSDAEVVHELQLSRRSIRARLGHDVDALVYPEDNYDARLERLAHANGYVLGFTEDHGNADDSANLLEIHRYSILKQFDTAIADVLAASP